MNTIPRSTLGQVSHLSDRDLLAHLHLAAQAERRATAHLVARLIEFDSRRLYLGRGFPSLFTYCTDALHLSEPAAYNRIEVARAARRFPIILDGLDAAELTPLTPERYKIQFTVSRQTHDKLRRAQDLLRHAVPNGDPAVIVDRALTLLLIQLERSKTGATDLPRTTGPGTSRRATAASR